MSDRIIAIGGSLGGFDALSRLCKSLPGDFPAAVCMVLHVGPHGKDLLADIFGSQSRVRVRTARDQEPIEHGVVYVAPADRHLLIIDGHVRLGFGPRENMTRPAIDPLLRSVGSCYGSRAIGVLLTGLLNDGASGLADLKRCGGVTVVQSPRDAYAPAMPLAALASSQIDYRATIDDLPDVLGALIDIPAAPSPPVPPDIDLEIQIALGTPVNPQVIGRIADPSSLSCPSCGGVLSKIRQHPPARYRCQVGHGFSAEVLEQEQEGSIDEAMRMALRILEERVTLARQMAHEAQASGRPAAARSYNETAIKARARANVLQSAICSSADATMIDDANQ